MELKRPIWLLAVVALLFSLLPVLVAAGPNVQEGQNLLANPGFEGGWHWQADSFLGKIADDWVAWWVDDASGKSPSDAAYWKNQRPEYGLIGLEFYIPDQIHSGGQALQYGKRYATHTAGVHQQVSGIAPGSGLRFSAWGFVYGKDPDSSRTPGFAHMKVGIDPTGGTNPFGGSVVWSGETNPVAVESGSAWQQMSVEAQAQNSTVTVFVYSSPDWPMEDALTSQWDDTSLVVVSPAETATTTPPPPPPTGTPGPPPPPLATSTPRPDGAIVHTVQSGDTLWAIAIQYASGTSLTPQAMLEQINRLNNSPALIYSGQELVIAVSENPIPAAATAPESEGEPAPAIVASDEQLPAAAAIGSEQPTAVAAPLTNSAICVSAYHDRSGDGARDLDTEELLANAGFALSSENGVVGSYTSDGVSEPYCFRQLIPGTYMIELAKPAGYNSITPEYWAVALAAGATANVKFGVKRDPNAPESTDQPSAVASSDEQSDSLDNLLEAATENNAENQGENGSGSKSLLARLGEIAIGVSGVFVLLLAAAVGVAFVASRRRV
jgi:LysM repeat protein